VKELLRTTDIVLISFVNTLLNGAGIEAVIADAYISSVEGSIGAFPRRVLVSAEDWLASIVLLRDAGVGAHLVAEARAQPAHPVQI